MCSWQNMGWGKAQENCKMKKRKPLFSYKLILSCFSEVITVNKFREHRKQFNIRHPVSLKKKKKILSCFPARASLPALFLLQSLCFPPWPGLLAFHLYIPPAVRTPFLFSYTRKFGLSGSPFSSS